MFGKKKQKNMRVPNSVQPPFAAPNQPPAGQFSPPSMPPAQGYAPLPGQNFPGAGQSFPPINPFQAPQNQPFQGTQSFPQGQPVPFAPQPTPEPVPMPALYGARYYKRPTHPLIRLLSFFLAVGAVGFLVYYIYTSFVPQGDQYDTVKKASYGQSYDGQVLIVRDEVVYDDEGVTDIQYDAKEGSHINRTEIVSHVFSSGYSDKERRTLQNYRSQIKLYQIELLNTESTFDQKMDRLVEDVNARAVEVRNIVQGEQGNLVNLEETLEAAINERQNYFREKYAEDQRLSRLYDDETTQLKRIESWKKQNNANVDGIVSFYTDGYEFGLDISAIDSYTPAYIQRLINGQKPDESVSRRGRTDIYRMVKSNDWVALMLIQNTTWNPVQGSVLKLTLKQFSDVTVDAAIDSFARNGSTLLLRLRITSPVEQVLYTRSSKANIGQFADALSVPVRAIYKQDGTQGVVVLVDTKKIFVPCEIIQVQNGVAFIKPQHNNTLYEGQSVLLF